MTNQKKQTSVYVVKLFLQFQPRRPFQIGTTAFAPASYVV